MADIGCGMGSRSSAAAPDFTPGDLIHETPMQAFRLKNWGWSWS